MTETTLIHIVYNGANAATFGRAVYQVYAVTRPQPDMRPIWKLVANCATNHEASAAADNARHLEA